MLKSEVIHIETLSVPNQGYTITLKYLKDIIRKLLDDEDYDKRWIEGPYKTTGRPRVTSGEDERFLLDSVDNNKLIYPSQRAE